jgi:hypothetical protein
LKQASPVRAFPIEWNRERFHSIGNRSSVPSLKFAGLEVDSVVGQPLDFGEAAMGGRRLPALELEEAEQSELKALTSRRKTGQALALRARIGSVSETRL